VTENKKSLKGKAHQREKQNKGMDLCPRYHPQMNCEFKEKHCQKQAASRSRDFSMLQFQTDY